MGDTIRIQMMDSFAIYINDQRQDQMVNKSRKGIALIEYLILKGQQPVPNNRLLAALWPEESSSNPLSSLKTLVSRVRSTLNQVSDGLGNCIVANRGAYHWEDIPGLTVDVYEIEKIFDELALYKDNFKKCCDLSAQLLELYHGDLLQTAEASEWVVTRATALHHKYMAAIYSYVDMLKQEDNYEEIVNICRTALEIDNFDDRLHMDLMTALVRTNRSNEALIQYKHVMQLHYRYLGIQPSDEMQEFYKQIVNSGRSLEFNLESIRNELCETGEISGAFVCEYAVFKEIYNLQIRNLERLGTTMFLAVIMVTDINGQSMDPMKQEGIMMGLMEILKKNLRKGDTVTHFSPTILALLLATVNYTTGNMVMERIKRLFYRKYPNSNVTFSYRVGPISTDMKIPFKRSETVQIEE